MGGAEPDRPCGAARCRGPAHTRGRGALFRKGGITIKIFQRNSFFQVGPSGVPVSVVSTPVLVVRVSFSAFYEIYTIKLLLVSMIISEFRTISSFLQTSAPITQCLRVLRKKTSTGKNKNADVFKFPLNFAGISFLFSRREDGNTDNIPKHNANISFSFF